MVKSEARGLQPRTVVGVDGGGTSTVAIVAQVVNGQDPEYLSRGYAGSANPKAVGWGNAFSAIKQAIDEAKANVSKNAGIDQFESACIAVAGCGRKEDQTRLMSWLQDQGLAKAHMVVDDGQVVLRAGTPQGIGVAVIAGTGSLVIGRNPHGESTRAGGWGYLLGDEGSGYAIGLEGLKAVVRATDAVGPATELSQRLLTACGVSQSSGLFDLIYGKDFSRVDIAGLAPIVLEVGSEGDDVALSVVVQQLQVLARQIRAVMKRLKLKEEDEYHIALAGGLLVKNAWFRSGLLAELQIPEHLSTVVDEPAQGAIFLAADSVS